MPKILKKVPMPEQKPEERIKNFREVALGYTPEQAMEEALRCLQCKARPCVAGGAARARSMPNSERASPSTPDAESFKKSRREKLRLVMFIADVSLYPHSYNTISTFVPMPPKENSLLMETCGEVQRYNHFAV